MKKITLYSTVVLSLALGAMANAQDITGDRLDIGTGHTLSGTGATIAGGATNATANDYSSIGGGLENTNKCIYGVIAGGGGNFIDYSWASAVGGGIGNRITGGGPCVIAGGEGNIASGEYTTVGGGIGNVAQGDLAVVGGGNGNASTGFASTVSGGRYNTASEVGSTVPGGIGALANKWSQMAFSGGSFSDLGDAQTSIYVLRNHTTDTNLTELFLNGADATERMVLANDSTWTFDILVTSRSTTNSGGYQITGVIENVSGTTAIVGSVTKTVLAEDVPTWDVTVSADDTNDALVIKVNGDNTAIRWVATVRTVEVKN